jgi:hypothetical protein
MARSLYHRKAESGLRTLGHKIEVREVIPTLNELNARAVFTDYVVKLWVCLKCKKVFMLHKTPSSQYVTKHVEQFYSTFMFTVLRGEVYGQTFLNKVDRYFICDRLKNLA